MFASTDQGDDAARRAARLWLELSLIFVILPLVMALGLPPSAIWMGLGGMFVIAVLLLSLSDGFRWRTLLAGPARADWPLFIGFTVATTITTIALVLWLRPYGLFGLPRYNQELWLLIVCFYPFLSALPQEIVFRVLFFERYGRLFPSPHVAIAANAALFSLAHLFYWNWPAVILTACGGLAFAWAYQMRQSFLLAWLLHAVAGLIVFTVGLGVYFYHGVV